VNNRSDMTEPGQPVIRPAQFKPSVAPAAGGRFGRDYRSLLLALAATLAAGWFLWFIFTAKSVRLQVEPGAASVAISGGFDIRIGEVHVLRRGDYRVRAEAPGYEPFEAPLQIGPDRNQTYRFAMEKLPGRISFVTEPPGAAVSVSGTRLGTTPLRDIDVPSGRHQVSFELDRYQPQTVEIDVEGMEVQQTVEAPLTRNWAEVDIASSPPGARIYVDDEPLGETPATVEVLAGERTIQLSLPGHRGWRDIVDVEALHDFSLGTISLEPADGILNVASDPPRARVTVDGQYRGETPVELELRPGDSYRVQLFKPGYESASRTVRVGSDAAERLDLRLQPLVGTLVVSADPPDAELLINGESRGAAAQTLELPARAHRLEIRKPGYAGYSTEINPRPGFTQAVDVKLLTNEEARLAALRPSITNPVGQEMTLLSPGPFTMGASRREPGRRGNETLREVELTRLFYLSRKEVTNAQFRKFASAHDSGKFEEQALDRDDQPVVNVTWNEAALFCNWLSEQEGLPPFYRVEYGKVTGFDPDSTGYRLPTEAEWEWAARTVPGSNGQLRFPWGDSMPPPDRHGNYADRSASHLVGRIIFGYNDNHIVSAPVGTFKPNAYGLYDMGSNVAEWVHDFYDTAEANAATDPVGPSSGEYHVIRGASWMHGTITELRLSFRDFGTDGRQDIGFRVARFAE
jgi:formylglycine-generating enzyme required for sulfatase activity